MHEDDDQDYADRLRYAREQKPKAPVANIGFEHTHPAHYAKGGIEPRHLYESAGMARDFYRGNIIKYVFRYPDKGGIADLEKARVYLDFLLEYERRCVKVQQ